MTNNSTVRELYSLGASLTPHEAPNAEAADDEEKTRNQIKKVRNELERQRKTILFSHILRPTLAHGSHLIFAPDQAMESMWNKCRSWCKPASAEVERSAAPGVCSYLKEYIKKRKKEKSFWVLVASVVFACIMFKFFGRRITCTFQNVFLGWARWNQQVGLLYRLLSISWMMIVRQLLSNLLPFTSPAFAFLIAKSMPEGEAAWGTAYLLACSMPAGAVVPFLDWVAYMVHWRGRPEDRNAPDELPPDYYDARFRVTQVLSSITDYLPFSFWVRPLFMEPAFLTAYALATSKATHCFEPGHDIGVVDENENIDKNGVVQNVTESSQRKIKKGNQILKVNGEAYKQGALAAACRGPSAFTVTVQDDTEERAGQRSACAAVLAGHFMIWAGPATTMHQRNYVPDWWTCIFIQPLGLVEDVAIVLATWAGESVHSQKMAELWLLAFMILMNIVRFVTDYNEKRSRGPEHIMVGILTFVTLLIRTKCRSPFPYEEPPHTTTTTLTTTRAPECETTHGDVKKMVSTIAFVGFLAVVFRVFARITTGERSPFRKWINGRREDLPSEEDHH